MKNLDIKRINMLFGGGFQAFWEKPVNPQKETLRKLFVLFRKNEAKFKSVPPVKRVVRTGAISPRY